MAAPTPALLAMAAHGLYHRDVKSGWSKTKFERMRQVLWAKFNQHSDLAELLISTGEARLVETPTVDSLVNRTWGEVKGVGRNMLGQLLAEVRNGLRQNRIGIVTNLSRPDRGSRRATMHGRRDRRDNVVAAY